MVLPAVLCSPLLLFTDWRGSKGGTEMIKGLENLCCERRLGAVASPLPGEHKVHHTIPVFRAGIQRGQSISAHKEPHEEDKDQQYSCFSVPSVLRRRERRERAPGCRKSPRSLLLCSTCWELLAVGSLSSAHRAALTPLTYGPTINESS
ncbi:uncharacterized protein M8220_016526 isoform 1-T1 [Acridotheres tristis]